MSETGTPAEHAATRLATLTADPAWGKLLMEGNAAARTEFDELSRKALDMEVAPPATAAEGAAIDLFAPDAAQRLPTVVLTATEDAVTPSMTPRERLNDINAWRARGRNDMQIRELHDESRTYSAADHEGARNLVSAWGRDQEFQRRLFSGDPVAERQVLAASTILSGGVKAA